LDIICTNYYISITLLIGIYQEFDFYLESNLQNMKLTFKWFNYPKSLSTI